MTGTIQIIKWRPVRDMLPVIGFCKALFPSGISIAEIVVLRGKYGLWAAPPAQTWVKGGKVVLDAAGQVRHTKLIEFPSAEIKKQWSDSIVAALRERYPGFDSETTKEFDDE